MRPRLLDLFCGAGGAAMGYHRATWCESDDIDCPDCLRLQRIEDWEEVLEALDPSQTA